MREYTEAEKELRLKDLTIAKELEKLEEMIIADKDRQLEFIEQTIKKLLTTTPVQQERR